MRLRALPVNKKRADDSRRVFRRTGRIYFGAPEPVFDVPLLSVSLEDPLEDPLEDESLESLDDPWLDLLRPTVDMPVGLAPAVLPVTGVLVSEVAKAGAETTRPRAAIKASVLFMALSFRKVDYVP